MNSIGDRLRAAREAKGMTQEELGKACNTTKQTIFKYENGVVTNIPLDRLERMADILNVAPAYLMGWNTESIPLPDNVTPIGRFNKVPLLGEIACGEPILAEQNIIDYVDAPGHIRADYALVCHGDSMINAGIRDGDIVYIRQQDMVDNGQIAAVIIDNEEATLKRFHYDGNTVILSPANDTMAPRSFTGEAMNSVRVLGRAVAFLHNFGE